MAVCPICNKNFNRTKERMVYCTIECKKINKKKSALAYYYNHRAPLMKEVQKQCENCQKPFVTKYSFKIFCSNDCKVHIKKLRSTAVRLEETAANGTTDLERVHRWRGYFTSEEIAALRADPLCLLPNRTLRAQWRKCHNLGIPRDESLRAPYRNSKESERRAAAARSPERRRAMGRRAEFRQRVRSRPERFLAELQLLARRHPYAEDLVVEGYAIMLRDCVPASEAFKLAKAEVARSSAQPFREQSFDPEINYEARETGRQVARASDIKAANGDG